MAFDSDSPPTPEALSAEAAAVTASTTSALIYQLLFEMLVAGIDLERVLAGIADRCCLCLAGLQWKADYLRRLAAISDSSSTWVLARDVLLKVFAHGLHLRTARDRSLRVFTGTHWEPITEHQLRQIMAPLVLQDRSRYGPPSAIKAAIEVIKDIVPADDDLEVEVPERVINTLNIEILVTDHGDVIPRIHRPEHALHAVLPVNFDKDAECPTCDDAVAEMFSLAQDRARLIGHLWELFGFAIQPRRDIPVILFLLGAGSNGKSTLIELLKGLVGRKQVRAGKISALTRDRFTLPDIEGCLLALEDDGEQGEKIKTGILKTISENRPIDTRRVKSTHGTSFTSTLMPVIATNGAPLIEDVSHGFYRRLYVLPFTRRFKPEEMQVGLAQRIIDEEMSGVLNHCIRGLMRVRARGHFERPPECEQARAAFMNEANPFAQFLDEQCTRTEGVTTTITDVFGAFHAWSKAEGIAVPFGKLGVSPRLKAMGFTVRKSNVTVVDGLKIGKPSATEQAAEPPPPDKRSAALTVG